MSLFEKPEARKAIEEKARKALRSAPSVDASTPGPRPPGQPPRVPDGAGANYASRTVKLKGHGVEAVGHVGPAAAGFAREGRASAVAVGKDVYFAAGAYAPDTDDGQRLIRHELAHVAQSPDTPSVTDTPVSKIAPRHAEQEREADAWERGDVAPVRTTAEPGMAYAHPVITTGAVVHTEDAVVGTGPGTGMTLAEFDDWSTVQLDWFSGLSETALIDLWQLYDLLAEGPHIRQALGAFQVYDLRLHMADLRSLSMYASGKTGESLDITVLATDIPTAAKLGDRLNDLEWWVGEASLKNAWTQADFEHFAANDLRWLLLEGYLSTFSPHIERAAELPRLKTFIGSGGALPFYSLKGKIRNLHRFPFSFLVGQLMTWSTSGQHPPAAPPVFLVLHAGHDWNGVFVPTQTTLLPNLASDARYRTILLEGPDTVGDATTLINEIGRDFGPIGAALLVGHGESRYLDLGGTGYPSDAGTYARYPKDSIDLDDNAGPTEALFDALLRNMDPASARILIAGCLVGTQSVPDTLTTDADIRGAYRDPARTPLAQWLEARPAGLGLAGFGAGFVSGARADTVVGRYTGYLDAAGLPEVQYPFDQAAFGGAAQYILTGRLYSGLLRSLREVMSLYPGVAPGLLATRIAAPPAFVGASAWMDMLTGLCVTMAQPAVNADDVVRITELEEVFSAAYNSYFNPANYNDDLTELSAADAATIFPSLLTTGMSDATKVARRDLVIRQAWMSIDGTAARAGDFLDELNTTTLDISQIEPLLLHRAYSPHLGTLLPLPPPAAPSQGQLTLAFIHAHNAGERSTPPGAGDAVELQFLHGLVVGGGLPAAVVTAMGTYTDQDTILRAVGEGPRLAPAGGAAVPAGATDSANVRLGGPADADNDAYVHGDAYIATVRVNGSRVRRTPDQRYDPIRHFNRGDTVRVIGRVHGWSAVYFVDARTGNGRLGFIWHGLLSSP